MSNEVNNMFVKQQQHILDKLHTFSLSHTHTYTPKAFLITIFHIFFIFFSALPFDENEFKK